MRNVCESFIAFVERKKVSASDFSILVTGLPKSVSKEELRDHFSYLFALDGSGVTAQGTWLGGNLIAGSEERKARRAAAEAAEREAARAAASASAARTVAFKKGGYVLGPPLNSVTVPTDTIRLRDLALAAKKATERRKKDGKVTEADPTVDFRHRLEVVASGPVARPRPDPLTGAMPRMPRPEYWGSWVANVHVVRPTAKFISKFRAAEAIAEELREARAEVKMFSHPTPLPSGADKKKRDDAYARVDELGEKLKEVQDAVREAERATLAATSSHDGGCIGTAFVTFQHEESMQRCLRAYEGGSMAFGLWYPAHLRFRSPATPGFHHKDDLRAAEPDALVRWKPGFEKMASLTASGRVVHEEAGALGGAGSPVYSAYYRDAWSNFGKGYNISVQRAPDPADVQHENLEMRFPEKCARRSATSVVTILAVVAGLVLMTLAQYFSTNLRTDQPDLTACNTVVPTLYFQGALNYAFARAFDAAPGAADAPSDFLGNGKMARSRAAPGGDGVAGARALLRGQAAADPALARAIPAALAAARARGAAAPPAAAAAAAAARRRRRLAAAAAAAAATGTVATDAALANYRTEDAAPHLLLTRLPNSEKRLKEDGLCGVKKAFAVGYRYNFTGSSSLWATWNATVPGRDGVVQLPAAGSFPGSGVWDAALIGTAVAYGATKPSLQQVEATYPWAAREDACRATAAGTIARDPCSPSAQWCALRFFLSAAAAAADPARAASPAAAKAAAAYLAFPPEQGKAASRADAPSPPLSADAACPDPRVLRSADFLQKVRASLGPRAGFL